MLAIVIPYYKKAFFKETLLSLEKQTDKRFFVYIGNDGSPEDPKQLIEETLLNTNFSYKKYEDNLGAKSLSSHWERVLDLVNDEEWIMILGDDDVLDPNIVFEFYNNLELANKNNISLIKFSRCNINKTGTKLNDYTSLPQIYSSIQFLSDRLKGKIHSTLSENIFRKNIYKKYRFQDLPLAWHTDDIALLEFSDLKNFIFVTEGKLHIRISEMSISGQDNNNPRKAYATYFFLDYILKNYSQKLSKEFVRILIKRYREIVWKNGFSLDLNLPKIFITKNDFFNAIKVSFTNFKLRKKIAKTTKSCAE